MDRKSTLLTLDEMAIELRTTPRTLRKHVRDGGIPFVMFGRSMLFDLTDVKVFLKGKTYARRHVVKIALPKKRRGAKVQIKSKFAEALGA